MGWTLGVVFLGRRTASGPMPDNILPDNVLASQFYVLKLNNSSKNFNWSPRGFVLFICLFVSVASGKFCD